LTDNPPVPRLLRRSSAALFALAFVCALVLSTGGAVAAGSGGGPLSGGVTAPANPTPTTATQIATNATTTAAGGGGGGSIGKSSIYGIVIGSVIVIGGVCFYIFRDAARRAPSRVRRTATGPSKERKLPGSQRVKPRKLSSQERRRRKRGRAPRRK
jgi:hypothetical protein